MYCITVLYLEFTIVSWKCNTYRYHIISGYYIRIYIYIYVYMSDSSDGAWEKEVLYIFVFTPSISQTQCWLQDKISF